MLFHIFHIHPYKKIALDCADFWEPQHAQQHCVQISYTEFHLNQTMNVENTVKNSIMLSVKCFTAQIFTKLAITEYVFVDNVLYRICFLIGNM
jgi:hypothetical protein